ncbi:MAG: MogA/MoaB family molybdenum cofactor biosynthesis protein [Candidatus Hadarchaeales archaeon]
MKVEHQNKLRKVGILVVSDTRAEAAKKGKDTDVSGRILERELRKKGYNTIREIIPNNGKIIKKILQRLLRDPQISAILITGGTGISKRDVTIETVEPMYEKYVVGIGEALRKLGYERIGFPALLSRTSAGIISGKPVFCLPGTPNAVKVSIRFLLQNFDYIIREASK